MTLVVMGVEYSFSAVHAVSSFQLHCTGIDRESRGSPGILFSRYISQFEENRLAGMAIPLYGPLWLNLTSIEVDPATVATDSFMTNVHLILLRFAEPFMDAQYTKVNAVVTRGNAC